MSIKKNGMAVSIRTISPDEAKRYQATSLRNRPLNDRRVSQYARSMRDNNWSAGSMLIIDEEGHMVDGHHRMAAIIQAGTSVDMVVLSGLPTRFIPNIDTGRPRSAGDMLAFVEGLEGVGSLRNKAALTRMVLGIDNGDSNIVVSHNEIADFMLDNIALIEKSYKCYTSVKALGVTIGVGAAVCVICRAYGIDCPKFDEFWCQVASGEMLKAGLPAFALRNALFASGRSGSGGSRQRNDAYCVLRAWDAFIRGERLTVIRKPRTMATSDLRVDKIA